MDIPLSFLGLILRVIALLCLFRFLCQALSVNPNIPLVSSFTRATTFLGGLRKVLPRSARVDSASLVGAWGANAVFYGLRISSASLLDTVPIAMWLSFVGLLQLAIWIFMISIVAAVVVSWVAPQSNSPNVLLVRQLSEPLLRPVRQILPSLGGLDFTPMLVLFALVTILQRVVPWLHSLVG